MRAAAILGLGCSPKNLRPFQLDKIVEWRLGMPVSGDRADVILLFGGDGTVHRHLLQLVRLGLPVLVVPAGSGNDFARALGLRRVRDSLAAWQKFCSAQANVRPIDLGVITRLETPSGAPSLTAENVPLLEAGASRYFCSVAGVGLDVEVARRSNRLPRWLRGNGGYVLTLLPTIFRFAPLPVRILAQDNSTPNGSWTIRSDQPTMLAAFANTPVYGGGMKIAPQAHMDDGLLDVCIVGGVDPFKMFCLFPTVYTGGHLKIREVTYFQARRVRVETEDPLDVYADGEYVCRTPVEVTAQPAALKVIVPAK
jgi:diacylglycerol kinase (ATP)